MRDLVILLVHLIATLARLMRLCQVNSPAAQCRDDMPSIPLPEVSLST